MKMRVHVCDCVHVCLCTWVCVCARAKVFLRRYDAVFPSLKMFTDYEMTHSMTSDGTLPCW